MKSQHRGWHVFLIHHLFPLDRTIIYSLFTFTLSNMYTASALALLMALPFLVAASPVDLPYAPYRE